MSHNAYDYEQPNALLMATKLTYGLLGFIAATAYIAAIILAPIAAWLTSIVVSAQTGNWIIFVADWLFAPIGVVHGVGHWFGWW